MIKPDSQLFDDLARMAGGAAGMMNSVRQQIESEIKTRIEELAARMDLVPREDFDRLEARLDKVQQELETLKTPKKTAKTVTKKTAKKTTKKK